MRYRNKNKSFFFFFIFFICLSSIYGQEYSVDIQKYSIEDGLSNRFTRRILKDSNGLIWILTRDGLNSFDGYRFKQYPNVSNMNSNRGNLWEDDQQRIWVKKTVNQRTTIDILDTKTDTFQSFSDIFKEPLPFRVTDVWRTWGNDSKEIWLLTLEDHLYKYANNTFTYILSLPGDFKSDILRINNEFIWTTSFEKNKATGTKKVIRKLNLNGTLIEELFFPDNTKYVGIDSSNILWIYQKDTLQLKQLYKNPTFKNLYEYNFMIPKSMYAEDTTYGKDLFNPYNDMLWWFHEGTEENNFFAIDITNGDTIDIMKHLRPLLSYKSRVMAIEFLSENQVWLATEDGIFVVYLKKKKFTTLLTDKENSSSIRAMVKDDAGVLHVSSHTKQFQIHPNGTIIKLPKGSTWLCTVKEPDGTIWRSTYGKTLEKYNPASNEKVTVSEGISNTKESEIAYVSLFIDTTKRLWIGTSEGLFFKDHDEMVIQEFDQFNAFSELASATIHQLYKNSEGLWLVSSAGLYLLDKEKGIVKRYSTQEELLYKIPYDNLLHLYEDKEGVFWLSTNGGGLIKLNPSKGASQQFTNTNGLSSNIIYSTYEDSTNRLWLPSEYGLMLFDKKTASVQTFFIEDGIAHNEFNTYAHYKDNDGKLYFGGLAGITVVDPEKFTVEENTKAPLYITGCQILNSKTGKLRNVIATVNSQNRIALTSSDISLLLDFSLLNYSKSFKNTYTYKVEGIDNEWSNISQNSLRLNNLPAGNYTIRIKGKDARGTESANEIALPIVVAAPFYKEYWFIVSCFLAFGAVLYILFRIRVAQLTRSRIKLEQTVQERTKQIEEQATKLRELDTVKSRFFANISHELRTPLTLILGPLYTMISKASSYKEKDIPKITSNLQTMHRNGKSLLHLIEEILDISKLEAHKIELEERPIPFYSFCKRIFSSFESMAKSRNIVYAISYEINEDLLLCIDDNKVEKIITNLVSNAFKYSEDHTEITIQVKDTNTTIHIIVCDTGSGIHKDDLPYVFDRFYQSKQVNAPAYGGTGIGLALCKELAALMDGKIDVKSTLGEGSTFILTFPKKDVTDTSIIETANDNGLEDDVDQLLLESKDSSDKKYEKKPTVLVVEDHEDMRNFIVETLQDHYHIQTANNGEAALSNLKNGTMLPDIIVSDVMMPNMDGFTMLQHIKSEPKWRTLPLILLTARATENDVLNALEIGVNDYVTKPFNPPELLARIQNLLRNDKERKEWLQKEIVTDTHITEGVVEEESWDVHWLNEVKEIAKREIKNSNYKIPEMALEMRISESQLLIQMKQITGFTPKEFIREIRLQHARTLMENKVKRTISEVAYASGFNTPTYFSSLYKKRFGKGPASYFE